MDLCCRASTCSGRRCRNYVQKNGKFCAVHNKKLLLPLKTFASGVVRSGYHFSTEIWKIIFEFVEKSWERRISCKNHLNRRTFCCGGLYYDPNGKIFRRDSRTVMSELMLEECMVAHCGEMIEGEMPKPPMAIINLTPFKEIPLSAYAEVWKVKTLEESGFSRENIKGLCTGCLTELVEKGTSGKRCLLSVPKTKYRKLEYLENCNWKIRFNSYLDLPRFAAYYKREAMIRSLTVCYLKCLSKVSELELK